MEELTGVQLIAIESERKGRGCPARSRPGAAGSPGGPIQLMTAGHQIAAHGQKVAAHL